MNVVGDFDEPHVLSKIPKKLLVVKFRNSFLLPFYIYICMLFCYFQVHRGHAKANLISHILLLAMKLFYNLRYLFPKNSNM